MTTEEKAELAINLIERASYKVTELAALLRASQQPDEGKLSRAMQALEALNDFLDERAPDENWWHEYFTLTGDHMHLTEEGWIPADQNTREATGFDPMEVLCEVNAP